MEAENKLEERVILADLFTCEGNNKYGGAIYSKETGPRALLIVYNNGEKEISCRCVQKEYVRKVTSSKVYIKDFNTPRCNPASLRKIKREEDLGVCIYLLK